MSTLRAVSLSLSSYLALLEPTRSIDNQYARGGLGEFRGGKKRARMCLCTRVSRTRTHARTLDRRPTATVMMRALAQGSPQACPTSCFGSKPGDRHFRTWFFAIFTSRCSYGYLTFYFLQKLYEMYFQRAPKCILVTTNCSILPYVNENKS